MTEHERALGTRAFEACGYLDVFYDDHVEKWKATGYQYLNDWSSTDAAIAHAERGGFDWRLDQTARLLGKSLVPSLGKYTAQVWDTKSERFHNFSNGSDDNPGLAIRNAILGAEANGKPVQ